MFVNKHNNTVRIYYLIKCVLFLFFIAASYEKVSICSKVEVYQDPFFVSDHITAAGIRDK